ncbi:restriction endonuclease [Planococcus sp. CPCC 101016]|uniref:HNH endonuclease n=1 Tax=Planococcus sp. CPCC 101016 TaxID=2599617 RepID=UPI0011B44054|nr:HNH endonuclease [Planococcus sp. CPCC 101016]TWT07330.1 restriction endonuclease [Planococcus sp. CPCC 101016]
MITSERRKNWLIEIKAALVELGGQGTLKDIYNRIEERSNLDLTIFTDWKSQIRNTMYRHSSDCEIFKGKIGDETDIFYSIEGKGNGFWGIRDFTPFGTNVELTEDDMGFVEGKKMLRQHILRERDPKVIKLAKEKFKFENDGRLFCEVCGFDFYQKYGDLGEDYIEGHHINPLSMTDDEQETKIQDIAMVCSNCHRMLHRRRPWLTKEKLQLLLSK